ncbi:hypothetical protein F4779DRAFT_617458 [Xylariaceae sp. FL0662B]|nr:hypothetical protein F4779DRAFT_617458 [Xylariaceae sp. FL0662B]
MVSIKSLAVASLAALPVTSAWFTALDAPETATAGQTVTATLTAAIYIQNWDDFGIVWGLAPENIDFSSDIYVGQKIQYTPLYPDNIPKPGKVPVDVTIPEGFTPGTYKLVAAVPYLVGASGLTSIQVWNSTITINAA